MFSRGRERNNRKKEDKIKTKSPKSGKETKKWKKKFQTRFKGNKQTALDAYEGQRKSLCLSLAASKPSLRKGFLCYTFCYHAHASCWASWAKTTTRKWWKVFCGNCEEKEMRGCVGASMKTWYPVYLGSRLKWFGLKTSLKGRLWGQESENGLDFYIVQNNKQL